MLCPGVTWIRKIIRKLLVLYSLPLIPQRQLALSVFSLSFCFSFGGSRALTRRRRPHRASPDSPSAAGAQGPVLVPSSLCICCCMYAVRLHSADRALLLSVPVARDKLLQRPDPATASEGVSNSGLQIHSVLTQLRYGNEIVH